MEDEAYGKEKKNNDLYTFHSFWQSYYSNSIVFFKRAFYREYLFKIYCNTNI